MKNLLNNEFRFKKYTTIIPICNNNNTSIMYIPILCPINSLLNTTEAQLTTPNDDVGVFDINLLFLYETNSF
jgi:hypothetical protein